MEFKDITYEKLMDAIVIMLNVLDISGSVACEDGGYDIYTAILKEWEKAKQTKEDEI